MEYPKFYIGPMSKNVVDAVIEFTEETDNKIGFIPSRRQVEYSGGYVNNWTTEEFSKYVNGRVLIARDHGGSGQGYKDDDGFTSFKYDTENFDIIHIDPWKKYQNFEDGVSETLAVMNYIHNMNPNTEFEVGTEEAIRKFTPNELNELLKTLSEFEFFDNVKYAVVQSGVGIDLGKRINTGKYDESRLSEFIDVCRYWNVFSKEHNGETMCYIKNMGANINELYNICYKSKRWEKWVGRNFVPEANKKELIQICGHYILSDKTFINIKPDIDDEIKSTIKNKLKGLFDVK